VADKIEKNIDERHGHIVTLRFVAVSVNVQKRPYQRITQIPRHAMYAVDSRVTA